MSESESKDLVNWEEQMAQYAVAAAAVERPTAQNISMRGGIMTYAGQPAPGNKMTAIILASILQHLWFPNKFDPLNPTAPDCFAFSIDGEGMAPHEKSADPQSTACATCEKMRWGSDPNSPSKRGKWCKQSRKLALVPLASLSSPEAFAASEMAILNLPVTSVGNWGNYVAKLATVLRRPPCGVVTQIQVEPDPKSQFKVKFAETELIDTKFLPMIFKRVPLAQQVLMTPYEKDEHGKLSERTENIVRNRKY